MSVGDKPLAVGNSFHAAWRMAAFLGLIGLMLPVHIGCLWLMPRHPYFIPRHFHRILVRILGFRLRLHGAMAMDKPVLFIANHTSYLDIPVLGSLLDAAFVAKSEVAGWPLFGFLAKMHGTIFIERNPARVVEQTKILRDHLASKRNLILFPEGTSSDGLQVLPFKSALFSPFIEAAAQFPVWVQPVSAVCSAIDSMPLTRTLRPLYAWYGDMTLLPHLWQVFKMGRFTIDVVFHPAVPASSFKDRKALAQYCQTEVSRGNQQALTGRGIVVGVGKVLTAAENESI